MVLRRDQQEEISPPSFTLLPDGKSRKGVFLTAIAVEFVLALLILAIPSTPPQEIGKNTRFSELAFQPAPVVKRQPPAPKTHVILPRLEAAKPPVFLPPRPKFEPRRVPVVKAPVVTPEFHAPAPIYRAKEPPRPAIHTGVLSAAVAPPKVPRTMPKVQTGGFGDPAGVPANDKASRGMTIATVGSFGSPVGPGSGNGTGGSHGARGEIARAGFGDAVASPGQSTHAQSGGPIRAGVFSNQAAVPAAKAPVPHAAKPSIEPVEILEKPDPVYTAEARARKIEGNVVLDVIFSANGTVDVLRVVRGLGYGLDQAAISAARRIRFQPERIDGKPVDERARLRIVFRLAY